MLGLFQVQNNAKCPNFLRPGELLSWQPSVSELKTPSLSVHVCCLCTDSVAELRKKVAVEHEQVKQKDHTPKASYGYGGKFGVEKDRMDKVCHHIL